MPNVSIDYYRAAVIATSSCPWCGAKVGQRCRRTDGVHENGVANVPVEPLTYVHDDRSAVHAMAWADANLQPSPDEMTIVDLNHTRLLMVHAGTLSQWCPWCPAPTGVEREQWRTMLALAGDMFRGPR